MQEEDGNGDASDESGINPRWSPLSPVMRRGAGQQESRSDVDGQWEDSSRRLSS
jgi:hypothetical protein